MKKLDQSKVVYIVTEKQKGTKNAVIAKTMGRPRRGHPPELNNQLYCLLAQNLMLE